MKLIKSDRGFEVIIHDSSNELSKGIRLVQQSSAVGPYEDSLDKPGSSYLWIGRDHHLNREEVSELVDHLKSWLETGSLEIV